MSILITGAGSPATWGTVYAIRGERIVGCDTREDASCLVERCYKVPKPSADLICALLEICNRERVAAVICQVEGELPWLSRHSEALQQHGTKVLVSGYQSILEAGKSEIMALAEYLEVPVPKYRLIRSGSRGDHAEVVSTLYELGLPAVVKLLGSSGGCGVRVVKETLDYSDLEGKPGNTCSVFDLVTMLGDKTYSVLVTEYLPGREYTVDCLCDQGKTLVCVPRTRDVIRTGITFEGRTVNHPKIIDYCKRLNHELRLDYVVGYQFKEDSEGVPRLLECNPRVQGTTVHTVMAGANIIKGGLDLAWTGETTISQRDVNWGVTMRRFWGARRSL